VLSHFQAAVSVWARAGAAGVVLAGRKTQELARVEEEVKKADPNVKLLSVSVDITIESQVQNLYDQIQKTFGRHADVLINNAGSGGKFGGLGQVPWDGYTNVVNTHYLGAALMSKYFISSQPQPTDPKGTIVYITSGIGGMILPGTVAYSIAKLAGQRLTEYLDADYPNLRAFTLSPGIIKTGLTQAAFEPYAKDHIDMPGLMSLYLAQERADYLRGGFVGINWDINEMEEHKDEIKEKKLLKMSWIPAKLGQGGHPFEGTS
jgi:NAD(P)-dependent dehydrogenase (short-subunit alcohol dehydrogenase family)